MRLHALVSLPYTLFQEEYHIGYVGYEDVTKADLSVV
jgi:hypothetical protein